MGCASLWRPETLGCLFAGMLSLVALPAGGVTPTPAAKARLGPALRFEPNRGQLDRRVLYLARAPGSDLHLTRDEAVLVLRTRERQAALRLRVAGAEQAVVVAEGRLESRSHYLRGSDPARWQRDVPHYERIAYRGVRPGIDLVFRGDSGRLEYDFEIAPGADAEQIRLEWSGADALRLDASGDLWLETAAGGVRQPRPLAWEDRADGRRPVEAAWRVEPDGTLRFALGPRDPAARLVIDPVIEYGSYLGAGLGDAVYDIAVDADGHAYVTGVTVSPAFPTQGPFQAALAGNVDSFVTKLTPDGSALVYSTFLGGSSKDNALAIAVDPLGQAVVTGSTASADFPIANAAQPTPATFAEAFVTKLSADGSSLVYSTFHGGNGSDSGWGIAADASGAVVLAGETSSSDLPLLAAAQPVKMGGFDGFVTAYDASGAMLYSTYLGGSAAEIPRAVAVHADGRAWVIGQTESCDFPTLAPVQASCGGGADAFATAFDPTGAITSSTYLGGAADDYGFGAAVDAHGSLVATGRTLSVDFPTWNPLQPLNAGLADAFVTKLDALGGFVYSTYLGGSGAENLTTIAEQFRNGDVAADASGSVWVTGVTTSTDLPVVDAFQPALAGAPDAFAARLTPDGQRLAWASYLGGSLRDAGRGIDLDAAGNAYVGGDTESPDFPATLGSFRPGPAGQTDGWVVRIGGAPACSDGIDNDGDGWTDHPADAGCRNAAGLLENPACDDGTDDDGDTFTDFPADPGCWKAWDGSEEVDCANGIDDDGDGAADTSDPGCRDAASAREDPACDDGLDNDGDGKTDWDGGPFGLPPDPQCTQPWKSESRGCGVGAELVLLGLALTAFWRRQRGQTPRVGVSGAASTSSRRTARA